ncbi:MAG TPA: retron system putative HNH endonuclease [Devosiaceae bacterium]|jgi:uncharacterized protein (TIGR02646 family)|nr:retron system putative HNH endonuclease [Devosiaceae bacterium]
MRKLTKATKPTVLIDNDATWTSELLAAQKGSVEYKAIESRYNEVSVKDALREETRAKCAYCESRIEAVAWLHIEHIVPKSAEPSLTFEWTNLTLACPICNNKKGTRRPTISNFVHPYDDDPENRLGFVGNMIKSAPGDAAAANMIHWIDLNRVELFVERTEVVIRVRDIFEQAIKLPADVRKEFVELSLAPLIAPAAKFSRVALCSAALFEVEYSAELDAA